MKKYWSRLTSSARGEVFNPLTYPFLLAMLAYSLWLAVIIPLFDYKVDSTLYIAMAELAPVAPIVWGIIGLGTLIAGVTFMLFNIPPFGKVSGLVGFALWLFGAICFVMTDSWLSIFSVAVPNMIFWIWQYLSLSRFRREDARDAITMEQYGRRDFDSMNSEK